jgi:hypothetical protein
MFEKCKLTKSVAGLLFGFAGLVAVSASASAAVLTIEDLGTAPGTTNTLLQRVNLGAAGLTSINTIVLTDISAGAGGNPGIFSGYDLDAVFLDRDGNIATAGDRIAFSSLAFTGGVIRPTADVNQTPSAPNNIGAYFGTNTAGNIVPFGPGGAKDATLNTFDGVNSANRLNANGFLSFGDGGVLTLSFANILVGDGLYLLFGEVGGQGEKLQVEAPGQVPLPGAVWLFLSAIAVLFGMSRRRSAATV